MPGDRADHAPAHLPVELAGNCRHQQCASVHIGQPGQVHFRQPGEGIGLVPVADPDEECDRLAVKTAGHECQRLSRSLVEPLRVINQAEKRLALGPTGQQTKHGKADQEPVRRWSGAQTEGDAQRGRLGLWKAVEVIEHRSAQLMDRGVGQFHFRLDPVGAGHVKVRACFGGVLHEG